MSGVVQVDGQQYTWRATTLRGYEPTLKNILIKSAAKATLDVRVWQKNCEVVTPDITESLVRSALNSGWDPTTPNRLQIGVKEATIILPK